MACGVPSPLALLPATSGAGLGDEDICLFLLLLMCFFYLIFHYFYKQPFKT